MSRAWFSSASPVRLALLAALLAALPALPARGESPGWTLDAARSVATPPGVRALAGPSGDLAGSIAALERAGFRVDVALPGAFFVRPGPGAVPPPGFEDVTAASTVEESIAGPSEVDPEDAFGGRADAIPRAGEPPLSAAGARARPAAPLDGLPYGARWADTSELMVGRVAVALLFPESDGSVDPDRYDWTPALRDSVIRSATRGLLRWTTHAAAYGVPLSFAIEIHPALATGFEPIDRTVGQELAWIEDALQPLVGYREDALAMAYDVANAARARLGAQWAALVFAVQNDTDPDGTFPDGFIAHAQLGGPWFVVPVNNLNSASVTLDFYMEHEMAHMFWALDEFPAANAWWACTLTTGYFNQPNTNSRLPAPGYCGLIQPCLMVGNFPDQLCAPTARQIGWVDRDLSGILDLFETRPTARADSMRYAAASGVPLTIRGRAADVALPNQNPFRFGLGDSITIATIDSVWYRLDAGDWTPIDAEDGRMDQGAERFVVTLPPLGAGEHVLLLDARNSSGLHAARPESTIISVTGAAGSPGSGPGGAGALRLRVGPVPARGPLRLELAGTPGSRGVARVFDVGGREIRSWDVAVPASGVLRWEWDGRAARGGARSAGIYFVTVQIGPGRLARRVVLLH